MYMRQASFKLLEFNVYDDNRITDNSSKYRDNREFIVQVFGLNEKGNTATIFIEGYTPFFYVKVDDKWDESKKTCFINEIKNRLGTFYEDSIVKSKLISKKTLYGFDAGKLHQFVQVIFKNTMALNRARKLWYNESYEGGYSKSLKPDGYVFEGTSTYLYESNFPPLLRLFHIMEISPSGWIALPEKHFLRHDKRRRTTSSTYEYTINYRYIIALDKNNRVPYKQCSFDIEASSSHGDFPVPIKNYKKLAIDIVNHIVKTGENEAEHICDMIKTAFNISEDQQQYPDINLVYPKTTIIHEEIDRLIEEFMYLIPKDIKLSEDMDEECEMDEPEEEEEDNDATENSNTVETGDINNRDIIAEKNNEIDVMSAGRRRRKTVNNKSLNIIEILKDPTSEYKLKVKELCKSLTHLFPPLEGDRVTFIGSTIKRYGEDDFDLKHCIVLNGCMIPEQYRDNHVIECYDTEREVLLAWQKFVQRENPDIITGYNINGFDFDFMYRRSKELKCTNDFLKLSRNLDEVCINRDWRTGKESIETMKIVLASGEYNLKYIKMTGRLIIDLYIYFRREYQLSSYKLDHTASQFICDDVKRIEHIETPDTNGLQTVIYSKNMKGINPGDYINFEEISYSTEYYKKGKKFVIKSINPEASSFTIDGREELNMDKKVKWGIAKDDVPPQEIFRLSNGDDRDRGIVAMYCIKDCKLVQDIIDKMDLLTGFIEMSNYCSVPKSFLLFRGQGIKLQSYVGKKCREKDTLMPTLDKSEDDSGYEGAIVLEPKTGIYLEDPVACVDYSSLYPSSMISENLSHDSKVWTREYNLDGEEVKVCGEQDESGAFRYDNLSGYTYIDVVYDTYEYIRKTPKAAATKVRSGYKLCRFAQLPESKSIMPSILEELLAARKSTKRLMNAAFDEGDLFMGNVYEKRQLTIKVTANSLYGQCGAKTSVFYDKDVAASTTAVGRKLLIYARDVIETAYRNRVIKLKNDRIVKTNAEYVYGDTDSVFFKFNLEDTEGNKIVGREALELTIELAKEAGHLATKFLKQPHDLEYEKTFMPFILLSKKRYVGMLYEENPDKGKIKFMGIVLKRRDNASIVKDIYGGIIDKIVKEKSILKAMNFTRECLQNMVDEKYPIEKLIVTKSLRGFYKNPKQIAHNVLADRIGDREQGNRPLPGDRIEYAYIKNPDRRALQGEKIETPNFIRQNGIKIDYSFYITNQIMKPILQLFALAVEDMNELKKRYGNSLNKWYRMLDELSEKWMDDEEKFLKKCEELKCKEVKAILFEPYLNMLK